MGQTTRRQDSSNVQSPRARSIASGVLLHGEMPPEPFTTFEDAPFLDDILRVSRKKAPLCYESVPNSLEIEEEAVANWLKHDFPLIH